MATRGTTGRSLPPGRPEGITDGALAAHGRLCSIRLEADAPETARAARQVTDVTLNLWGVGRLVPDVQLCVSELISNVVRHARGSHTSPEWGPRMLTVTWRRWNLQQYLDLEVGDDDPTPPALPLGEVFSPALAADFPEALIPLGGRGLRIVRSLADDVWWEPQDGGGKSVVCRFDISGVPREPRPTNGQCGQGRPAPPMCRETASH